MPPEIRKRGAVAVIVQEDRFLVIKRSQTVRAPGAFCFPGGAIETGETESQALVREIDEELLARVQPVGRLWESVTDWGVWLAWWQAEFLPDQEPQPNPEEVESIHWHTAAELRALEGVLSSNVEFLNALDRGEFSLREAT